ncbi:MAG: hypothetical protein H6581_09645 [Bacteroidia bacterium]|nr:hypothetical protein [Bacteroidia bacterium]
MKLSKIALICFALLAAVNFGCKPDKVKPNGNDMGAFANATGSSNSSSTVHEAPTPGCGNDLSGQLAMDYLGMAYPLPGTEYIMANDESDLFIQLKAMPGWVFSRVALQAMPAGSMPPMDGNGKVDATQFDAVEELTSPSNWYMWKISMTELEEMMAYCSCAKLVNSNNPAQVFSVWFNGKPIETAGGFTIDYQLGLQNCPGAQASWIGSCGIPSVGPGADLSPYVCGNPKAGKVNVCHLPPGNPENMQEICISTNALPSHIIDFKPANNPCMGHHSGCHLGPCDPCGPGSTAEHAAAEPGNCPGN